MLSSPILPLVSVILPVYNQGSYLEETINSILNQSFQDFELIILDDGSTDNSSQIIRRFAAKDKRVQAYFAPNSGKSVATNYLVNKARGNWCAFIDADDVMLPERLQKQVAFHTANPEVDASSTHCYYINGKGNSFGIQRYPGPTTITDYRRVTENKEYIICSFTGLMVSRKVFIETGGLRKKFEPCEDFDFFNRLDEKGFVLLIIPEVLMKYRIHESAVTVRKPILVFDTISFVKHCIQLRRSGQPEISFDEFRIIQGKYSLWKKINRIRFSYSMIFFRNAGFAKLSNNNLAFVWQIAAASVLSPSYVLKKVLNRIKK